MLQKPLAGIFKVLLEILLVYFFIVNWRQPFQYLTTFLGLLDVSNTAPMPLQLKKREEKAGRYACMEDPIFGEGRGEV